MDFHTACQMLYECVDEFYRLKKGAFISEPEKSFLFCDVFIGRRAIKHVVEQRKAEKVSSENMRQFFARMLRTISEFDLEILNTNQSDYPISVMRMKIFPESEIGTVIVLDKRDEIGRRAFITAFYCRPERIVLIQKKKPQ
jgi:hypothetical protein